MNKAESDRIYELCSMIAEEQDHKRFQALIEELNRILSAKNQRLQQRKVDVPKAIKFPRETRIAHQSID